MREREPYAYSNVIHFEDYLTRSEPSNVVRRASTGLPVEFRQAIQFACRTLVAMADHELKHSNRRIARTHVNQAKRLLKLRNLVDRQDELTQALQEDPVLLDLAFDIAVSRDVLNLPEKEVRFIASRYGAGQALMADLLVNS